MRHLYFLILPLGFVFLLSSCASPEYRSVIITDQYGKPIENAGVTPYPILYGNKSGNSSNERGEVKIYKLSEGGSYFISKDGFVRKEISYSSLKENGHSTVKLEEKEKEPGNQP